MEKETEKTEEVKEQKTANNDGADNVEELHKDDSKSSEEKETEDYKSKYYYLAAEMENLKKRQMREKSEWVKYGNTKILESLVEVMDNFDRTLDAIQDDEDEKTKNIKVGIDMVKKQFDQILVDNGLTPVETVGKTFDPNFHEALMTEESKDIKSGDIVKEFQKGYVLNGRLLRPSKVIVAK